MNRVAVGEDDPSDFSRPDQERQISIDAGVRNARAAVPKILEKLARVERLPGRVDGEGDVLTGRELADLSETFDGEIHIGRMRPFRKAPW